MRRAVKIMMLGVIGGKRQFSPLDVAGLQAWYDASDASTLFQDSLLATPVTADGQEIGAIKDKSLLGHNAIQATATKLPLYKTGIQNGKSIARFDGANDFLQTAAFTLNQPQHVFTVVVNRGLTGADAHVIVDGRTAGKMDMLWYLAATYIKADIDLVGGFTTVDNEAWLATALFSGTSSTHTKNQGTLYTGNAGPGAGGAAGVTLGAKGDGSQWGELDICEILVYNAALSDANKVLVENYLNTKWGIFTVGSGDFRYVSTKTTA